MIPWMDTGYPKPFDVFFCRSFKTPEMVEKEKEDAKWATAKVRALQSYPPDRPIIQLINKLSSWPTKYPIDQPIIQLINQLSIWLSSTFRWRRNLGWCMKRISSLGSETRQGEKDQEAVKINLKQVEPLQKHICCRYGDFLPSPTQFH